VAGTLDGKLNFIDIRESNKRTQWTLPSTQHEIKSICTLPNNTIACGQSTGHITILDTRTGGILNTWKPATNNLYQLKCYKDFMLLASSNNTIELWDASPKISPFLLKTFKANREGTISFDLYKDSLLCTSGDKVSTTSLIESPSNDFVEKLEGIRFQKKSINPMNPNSLTFIRVLPLQELLLIGTESGQIKVFY